MIQSGLHLRIIRREKMISQAKLSQLAGVSQALVSAYELGKAELRANDLAALEKVISNFTEKEIQTLRKKRYQIHEYNGVKQGNIDRKAKAIQTSGNREYLNLIKKLESERKSKNFVGKVISLFSGCGGFSLGFAWAGFEMVGFLELEESFRKIYKRNFPNTEGLGSDITQVSDNQLLEWKTRFGEIDVVIGGPPCQGFSLSGKRDANDPRNNLFKHYLRVVSGMKPKVAVMENVRLLTSMKTSDSRLVIENIYDEFNSAGYAIKHFEINAKDYGVPQHRERVIFVAVRKDLDLKPSIPFSTHGQAIDLFTTLEPYRTFADACSDLEYLESGEKSKTDALHQAVNHPDHVIEWLWNVPQGKSAHGNSDINLRPPSGYNTTYKRQVWNEPASTVQTTFGMISGCRNVHPIATRSLTIREATRIQSFPDSFEFIGSQGKIRTCIGNAVPPLLAHAIAKHIKEQLLNFVEVSSS